MPRQYVVLNKDETILTDGSNKDVIKKFIFAGEFVFLASK